MKKKISLMIIFASIFSSMSYAEIKMPSIFGDNMLLQRDMAVKIWGKADANAKVDVAFAGQKKSTQADANGNWSLKLNKMPANKNHQQMIIFENGKLGKTIKDILVGEVWIAGGQSNMGWTLANATNGAKYVAQANNPLIRYYSQYTRSLSKTPAFDTTKGKWTKPSPKVAGGYSAVGYLFAEKLQKDLDVPVGIVFTALGGSRMVAWIPEDKINDLEFTKNLYKNFLQKNANYDINKARANWKVAKKKWDEKAKLLKAKNKKVPRAPKAPNPVSYMSVQATPVYLYNAVVAPLVGLSARGVVWYQGESDANPNSLKFFGEQFELIVKSWREKFENPDLAFIQVQLAQYTAVPKNDWPLTRWKQYLATKSISKCYMANIIDCGEEKDIHPKDKTTVANRMENIALYEIYGQKNICPYGPIMNSVKYSADSAEISFNLFGQKLIGKGEPRGFDVKVNGEWKPAKAELVGKKVKVVAEKSNGKIEGVRYLWKNWCMDDVWLFNQNQLPALSFIHQK
ncbi:MAG: hypothetical protein J6K91_09885 [Opitutales bacterium]|nr:hypothetical protein [Opitutales bacterium]